MGYLLLYIQLYTTLKTIIMIIAHLIFTLYLHTGIIIPTGDVDGRIIYSMPNRNIEYSYKAEMVEYIATGTFNYNEDVED